MGQEPLSGPQEPVARESDATEYISALKASPALGPHVAHHRILDQLSAKYQDPRRPWPKAISGILEKLGIPKLYTHQVEAMDRIRAGRNVVVATPTASGKSLVYNLPVIERFLTDPDSKALYLFPLKALAQDQHKGFMELTDHWPEEARPRSAIYDGDTTQWFRRKIRNDPPQVLLTNPEMLHLSLLPHHDKWTAFLAGLSCIVVDEVHTYRGVMGSHMAQVFRRLLRICDRFGAKPNFVFCSATVGNPGELTRQLTGLDVEEVTESGAPQGKRHFLFLNPLDGMETHSASSAAINLLHAALHRSMRSIVYTQSRKMTELISLWAGSRSGKFQDRISAYRAGFLPEERREIEAKMASGELLAVISTSALELGIDIGALDVCILVGYPGTIMAALQRGGRVGRTLRDCAVVLIANEDALDQYFMRHPNEFFQRPPEQAVLNPHNPVILGKHLECAAAELHLDTNEPWLADAKVQAVVQELEYSGKLLRSKDGSVIFSARKQPHRDVNLRGTGHTFSIEEKSLGNNVGDVDELRAYKETHPGAVYLHKGISYVVTDLDLGERKAVVTRRSVDYYTRTRGNKHTEILRVDDTRIFAGVRLSLGRLRVTETITGYEKRAVSGGRLLSIIPLDLPPMVMETDGVWFEVPLTVQQAVEEEYLHFMGGIHAVEHAALGILPLLVMADRNDLGGISTPMHAQLGAPAVFMYEGVPGGVGLSAQAFSQAEELLEKTLQVITSCPCDYGCPSCVHSPKCGSGNRPIDKAAAVFVLDQLLNGTTIEHTGNQQYVIQINRQTQQTTSVQGKTQGTDMNQTSHFAVLDVETQLSAQEVGGWHMAHKMRVSVAVLYDSASDSFTTFHEQDMERLIQRLKEFPLIVGFNIIGFDYKVLSAYSTQRLVDLPTLDMLLEVKKPLSYRVSLDNLAGATLNAGKSADGLQALAWWKQGEVEKIAEYCQKDVAITRDLYLFGKENKHLLFTNKAKQVVRVPVQW
ncbi:MAG: DEAD/DEAH box helicase [Desulfovibrio sp.]|nr:MAG: DEAD/DEAH box helicase [Desulfovibrio sp.]